ncbi:hypothetical protein WK68_20315 [Burkholderia ubonensis]|nr:hypothetical protein WK68_20315 [Burkholderia ubonensis]
MCSKFDAAVTLTAVRDQHAACRRLWLRAQVELVERLEPSGTEKVPIYLAGTMRRNGIAVINAGLAAPRLM